jgi:biotin carboxyl carrier protein
MNIFTSVNDKTYDIDIIVDPLRENWFVATVDGREVQLGIIEAKPSSLTLSVDGRVMFYEFYKSKGRISSLVHNNQFYKVVLRNRQQDQLEQLLEEFGAGLGGTATDTRILAPMPGKILGISVKEGEKVELGRVVLVLEAMKMENEIHASRAGKIKTIHVSEGAEVQSGSKLVEFE